MYVPVTPIYINCETNFNFAEFELNCSKRDSSYFQMQHNLIAGNLHK